MKKMRREPSTEKEQLMMEQYVGTRPTSKLTSPEEQSCDVGHPECGAESVVVMAESWLYSRNSQRMAGQGREQESTAHGQPAFKEPTSAEMQRGRKFLECVGVDGRSLFMSIVALQKARATRCDLPPIPRGLQPTGAAAWSTELVLD